MRRCLACDSLMSAKACAQAECLHCHSDEEACAFLLSVGRQPDEVYNKLRGRAKFWRLTLEMAQLYHEAFRTDYANAT